MGIDVRVTMLLHLHRTEAKLIVPTFIFIIS